MLSSKIVLYIYTDVAQVLEDVFQIQLVGNPDQLKIFFIFY